MTSLNEISSNLVAISGGDVATYSKTTDKFANTVVNSGGVDSRDVKLDTKGGAVQGKVVVKIRSYKKHLDEQKIG